ncbi:MAG: winged helix-turn-helix transcriptional regulator [Jatrophihabitans sp.]|uniref:winged helix-turn-helix transcriptional regulator n=1 Tax=Jatrophihabitans sp. TaxID=1932789 RepID=UPI00390E57AD
MKRTTFANWPCSIARTVDLLGDWWTPLVLREAFYGTTRFDDFERVLGIGRNVLTQRLGRLVDADILERKAYQQNPPRYDYVLTDRGRDFFPVLAAINSWGDRWLATDDGPPVVMEHASCGHDTTAEVVCANCGEPLRLADVSLHLGPGYPERHRAAALATGRFRTPD